MNWEMREPHIEKAIDLARNASTPGLDRCPYELWKKLKNEYDKTPKNNTPSFNITRMLTIIFKDIQKHGIDPHTNFSLR
jgi:hypothetical protein